MNQRVKLILIIISSSIIAVLFYWSLHLFAGFKVASISPSPKDLPTSTPYITVKFTKSLASQDFSSKVSSQPSIVTGVQWDSKNSLQIELGNLDSNKTYTISLTNLTSSNKQTLTTTFTINTKYVPFNTLSQTQQQAILKTQENQKGSIEDPLLSHLPYGGLNYSLTGSIATKPDGSTYVVVNAQILPSVADADSGNEAGAIAQYKQQVQDYIHGLGLDPNNYTINYTVVEPLH